MNAPIGSIHPTIECAQPPASHWQARATIAYPLLLMLAVALVLPAASGSSQLHDNFGVYWVWADQFSAELARGNLYPRWLPLSNDGLGTPVFYYYPPVAFYLTGLFDLSGLSTYSSMIAAFAAAFAASGIACWHWLRDRARHPLIGAAFFMAAPYHLFDYSVRSALAETVAIAFIPLLAIGLRRIAERRGGVIFTAFAYAGIIFTHLPLALLASVFLIAPYALLHRRELPRLAIAVVAGVGLVAIYLLPALALEPFHDGGQLYRTPYLRTNYWNIYQANWSDGSVRTIFLIVVAILLAGAWPAVRRRDGWSRYAIGIAILMTGIVPMLWSLPLLSEVQFPYRVLPFAEFGLATALARLPAKPLLPFLFAAPLLIVSVLIIRGFPMYSRDVAYLRAHHPDTYEYLPKGVMKPGQTQAKLAEILVPRLPPPAVPGMVVEPTFYFPAWSCGMPEPKTQLLMHRPECRPQLVWTLPERIGAAISAAFGLLLLALGLRTRRKSLAA